MTSDESRTVISRSSGRCHPPYVGFHRHPSLVALLPADSLRSSIRYASHSLPFHSPRSAPGRVRSLRARGPGCLRRVVKG